MSDTGDTGVDDTHHNLLDSILTKQSVRKRAASNYDLVPMYQKAKQAEIQNQTKDQLDLPMDDQQSKITQSVEQSPEKFKEGDHNQQLTTDFGIEAVPEGENDDDIAAHSVPLVDFEEQDIKEERKKTIKESLGKYWIHAINFDRETLYDLEEALECNLECQEAWQE